MVMLCVGYTQLKTVVGPQQFNILHRMLLRTVYKSFVLDAYCTQWSCSSQREQSSINILAQVHLCTGANRMKGEVI